MSGVFTKNFLSGDIIYNFNDKPEKMYLIHSGKILIKSKLGLDLAILIEGEIFGEVGPIIETTRTVSAIANTDCTLKIIDIKTLHKKLEKVDPVLKAILDGLAIRIGGANKLAEKYWKEYWKHIWKILEKWKHIGKDLKIIWKNI